MVDPIAFHIPGLDRAVYWYGIMAALGFLVSLLYWNATAKRLGLPHGIGSDLSFAAIIGGILGARILYVAANWAYFSERPSEIIRIDQGGLIFYGGFIAASLAIILLARIRKIPVLKLGDFAISALPLGHAFGRIGCLLNGCCYGSECELPWAVFTADRWRHPVQGYEALFNLALFFFLRHRLLREKCYGGLIAIYLIAYGAWRFVIEYWRGDARMPGVLGLDAAQTLSLALVLVGLVLAVALRLRARPAA